MSKESIKLETIQFCIKKKKPNYKPNGEPNYYKYNEK